MLDAASRCEPPFPEDEALQKVANAYGRYEPGGSDQDSFQPNMYTPVEKKRIAFKSVQDLVDEGGETVPWVAEPYVVKGAITDVAGPAKHAGKTTWVTHMERCVLLGKPFMGKPTEKAAVVYLTEQGNNILEHLKKAGFHERNENLHLLRWRDTAGRKWPEIVQAVREKVEEVREEAGLPVVLVVDTLNRFAGLTGEKENNAGDVMAAMNPLLTLAQETDTAIVTIRHANKEGGPRGSTAFDHDVDILLTMGRPLGGYGPNVREIKGVGRYDGIPEKLLVELTEDGYRVLGTGGDAAFKQAVAAVRRHAPDNEGSAVKEDDLLAAMKEEDGVSRSTGGRAMEFLRDEGDLRRIGEGKKGDPYRCYLPKPKIPKFVSSQTGGANGQKRIPEEKDGGDRSDEAAQTEQTAIRAPGDALSAPTVEGVLARAERDGRLVTNDLLAASERQPRRRETDELIGKEDRPPTDTWSEDELRLLDELRAGRTIVVNMRVRGPHANLVAWLKDTDQLVKVDRSTEWGNPFRVPDDGDNETVVWKFEEYYLPHEPMLQEKLPTIRGKALGCWCAPKRCHAEVLKAWAEAQGDHPVRDNRQPVNLSTRRKEH